MDRRILVTLVVYTLLIGFIYVVYLILAPFLDTLGWAMVIGISTFPLCRRLKKRLGGRDTVSAAIMTPAVILTLVLPFALLVTLLAAESASVYQYVEKVTAGGGPHILETIRENPYIGPYLEKVRPLLSSFDVDLETTLLPAVKKLATFLLGYSTALIKNVFVMIIKLVLMVLALFFLYRDGETALSRLLAVLPLDRSDTDLLLETVRRVISAVIYGIFLTCLVQGALGGVGFLICGLPSPILFGSLMAVAALIPVVGTALIWLPAAVWLLLQGEVLKGVFLLAWGGLAVGMIDNLLRPIFISGKANLSILVIALGVLGGIFAFGPLGVVTGPIVLALLLAVFDIYGRRVFPGGAAPVEDGAERGGE